MEYKGLLFDLDGVLADTAKYHYLAWKKIAGELGIDFTKEDNERLKGVSRERSFEIILEIGNVNMAKEQQKIYCERKNKAYLEYIEKMRADEILPGVREFLEDCRRKGHLIALGSASKNSALILDRLSITSYFDAVIDGTKVSKAKPDPEVFQKGAIALGLEFEACVVFEDSEAGIDAAHRAGMRGIGVGRKENLPEADLVIPGFEGLTIEQVLEQS